MSVSQAKPKFEIGEFDFRAAVSTGSCVAPEGAPSSPVPGPRLPPGANHFRPVGWPRAGRVVSRSQQLEKQLLEVRGAKSGSRSEGQGSKIPGSRPVGS